MSIMLNGVDRASTINQASAEPHSAKVLADNPELYEIQRQNNFEFIVSGLNGILKVGMNGDETSARIQNAEELLRLSVDETSVPHYEQSVLEIKRGNTTMKAAGSISFPAGSIVVNDYIGAMTKDILVAWQNLSGNVETGKVGLMKDYKKEAWLVEYTPDYQQVRKWRMVGTWISALTEGNYSQSGDGKKNITATIQYDRAVIDNSDAI